MATVKLRLRPRHRKVLSRYSKTRCIVATALHDTYGGDWVVGYGTARRRGFLRGVTLRMDMSAQNAAMDHDRGRNAAGRTVTLRGNPGPTLAEKAEARRKAGAAKARAAREKAAVKAPARPPEAARSGQPGLWASLWNPAAAAQKRPQRRPARIVARTPAAAERARSEAASAPRR